MRTTLFLFCALVCASLFQSCSKDEDLSNGPNSSNGNNNNNGGTSLELTVKDHLGNVVSGATVKLYTSETNWANQTNQVGNTLYTNASGKVKFQNLTNIQYYWFAEKDCLNNFNGAITTTTPLQANATTTLDVILSQTGSLRLNNTSSNPYRIYINGTARFDMDGGTTRTINYVPTGSYSIRVLQLSGYLFTPTDQTYTGNVGCGQTLTTTFP